MVTRGGRRSREGKTKREGGMEGWDRELRSPWISTGGDVRRCHKKIGKTTTATAENFRLGKQFPSRRPATISPAEKCRWENALPSFYTNRRKRSGQLFITSENLPFALLAASNRCAVKPPLTSLSLDHHRFVFPIFSVPFPFHSSHQ